MHRVQSGRQTTGMKIDRNPGRRWLITMRGSGSGRANHLSGANFPFPPSGDHVHFSKFPKYYVVAVIGRLSGVFLIRY